MPSPERPLHCSAVITETANGTCVRLRGSRVAVTITVSRRARVVSRAGA